MSLNTEIQACSPAIPDSLGLEGMEDNADALGIKRRLPRFEKDGHPCSLTSVKPEKEVRYSELLIGVSASAAGDAA